MQKRLYRSRHDQIIGGVCGGISEYFGIDAVLIRLLAVAAILVGGGGLMAYIIMWIVIPEEPRRTGEEPEYEPRRPRSDNGNSQKVFGVGLICFGAYLALERFIPWNIGEYFWPAVLILGGVFILFRGKDEA
jgi:phage shock protein C